MNGELTIGSVGISVLLTILLKMVYGTFAVPVKAKPWIATFLGVAFGITALFIAGASQDPKVVAEYCVQGFMVGATAVGLNELMKGGK